LEVPKLAPTSLDPKGGCAAVSEGEATAWGLLSASGGATKGGSKAIIPWLVPE